MNGTETLLEEATSSSHHNLSSWESLHLDADLLFSGQEPTTIALEVIYSLSFVAGLVGNIMALRVLTRKKRNRLAGATATRSLLINLAICDMMVVCVCMPVTLEHQVYNVWVLGDFMCRAVPFVQAVSVSASVLSLSVISINRYYTVHNPLNARAFFTWRRIFWMICTVWTVSSGLCAPLIFMNESRLLVLSEEGLSIPVCAESWPYAKLRQGYNFLLFCSLYGFPVLFNLTICLLTGRRLWSNHQGFQEAGKRQKARKKIVKMVVALVLLFTLSWLPLYTIDIWIDFHLPNVQEDSEGHAWVLKLRPFAQWLGLTNSTLNPLCYCFIGNLYRSAQRMRESYRQRFSSVFHLHPQAQTQTNSSTPRLLSYRTSKGTSEARARQRECPSHGQTLVQCKSVPNGTVCETTFA
ncbi:gastrin/cholecystokinin type B receptor [Callorhinchus milii]|uniref:gastrin/cholecystokinin type B receptor n=1 Tax=Callorhinchus milii TaxID=7868 RepID=UPI000457481F|nr:gastrin/cholecystokinin type B receptor [Callorhinchus milii]|eukprot:gi/632943703/ref/XP_007887092.1/ PREDICTED: gastrin/cholecystokinin type B receptor-like [Callorhinchus milii]